MMDKLINLDEKLFLYLNHLGTETWDLFWLSMTNEWMSIPIYLLLSLIILKKKWFKPAVIDGIFIVTVVVFTIAVSHLFKYGIGRPRPCDAGLELRYLSSENCVGEFRFVSTHASVAFAMMLYIGMTLKKYYSWILWPLMIWVAFFCYSRIYVGRHYPGDVIGGLIIGFAIAWMFLKIRALITKKYQL